MMPEEPGFDGKLHVHVDNLADFHPAIRTEEVEPEHFSVTTVVIPARVATAQAQSNSDNGFAQLLRLDPMRKSGALLTPDGPLIICHSVQQANNVNNYVASTPQPEGGYLPQGANVALDGTGPLWGANPSGTSIRVTVIQNRRNPA